MCVSRVSYSSISKRITMYVHTYISQSILSTSKVKRHDCPSLIPSSLLLQGPFCNFFSYSILPLELLREEKKNINRKERFKSTALQTLIRKILGEPLKYLDTSMAFLKKINISNLRAALRSKKWFQMLLLARAKIIYFKNDQIYFDSF